MVKGRRYELSRLRTPSIKSSRAAIRLRQPFTGERYSEQLKGNSGACVSSLSAVRGRQASSLGGACGILAVPRGRAGACACPESGAWTRRPGPGPGQLWAAGLPGSVMSNLVVDASERHAFS